MKKNSRIPDSTSKSFPDSEIRITIGQSIALFSLYVWFFQKRSQGNLTPCLFYAQIMFAREKMLIERNSPLEYLLMTCIGK